MVHHAAVFHAPQHGLHIDGHHGMLRGKGDHLIGDIARCQTRQMPDGRVDGGHLLRAVGGDHTVHRGGAPFPVRRVIDVLRYERHVTVEGIDGDVGRRRKGCLQVHLTGVRLGQHRDLVAHIGRRKAGVVHRAANGLHHGAVIIHIRILRDLTDNEGIILTHDHSPLRMASSASTNDWNSGLHRWKRPDSIMAL